MLIDREGKIFATNVLIFVFGCILFEFSLWSLTHQEFSEKAGILVSRWLGNPYYSKITFEFTVMLGTLIGLSIGNLIISFVGSRGANGQRLFLINLYLGLTSIFVGLEVVCFLHSLTNKWEFLTETKRDFDLNAKTNESRWTLWNLEQGLDCCGATKETAFLYGCNDSVKMIPDCYSVLNDNYEPLNGVICRIGLALIIVQCISLNLFWNLRVQLEYGRPAVRADSRPAGNPQNRTENTPKPPQLPSRQPAAAEDSSDQTPLISNEIAETLESILETVE